MNLEELFVVNMAKRTVSKKVLKKAADIISNIEQVANEHVHQLIKEDYGVKQRVSTAHVGGRRVVTMHSKFNQV